MLLCCVSFMLSTETKPFMLTIICHYTECRLSVVMLSVVMLNVVAPSSLLLPQATPNVRVIAISVDNTSPFSFIA